MGTSAVERGPRSNFWDHSALFRSITAKPVDRKSAEWSQKLLLGPLSTADVSKRKASFHPGKPSTRRNASNEKVKPIALTLQNNLKGFTFKIVLFDNCKQHY